MTNTKCMYGFFKYSFGTASPLELHPFLVTEPHPLTLHLQSWKTPVDMRSPLSTSYLTPLLPVQPESHIQSLFFFFALRASGPHVGSNAVFKFLLWRTPFIPRKITALHVCLCDCKGLQLQHQVLKSWACSHSCTYFSTETHLHFPNIEVPIK